jgi:hypothetical protein
MSLLATLTSAIGYMAFPAGSYKYGIIMRWRWQFPFPIRWSSIFSYPFITN